MRACILVARAPRPWSRTPRRRAVRRSNQQERSVLLSSPFTHHVSRFTFHASPSPISNLQSPISNQNSNSPCSVTSRGSTTLASCSAFFTFHFAFFIPPRSRQYGRNRAAGAPTGGIPHRTPRHDPLRPFLLPQQIPRQVLNQTERIHQPRRPVPQQLLRWQLQLIQPIPAKCRSRGFTPSPNIPARRDNALPPPRPATASAPSPSSSPR